MEKIAEIINSAGSVVIIQADNPDGDSLASSLALEQILGEMGKRVHLYCGVAIPTYLRYMPGWDRVASELPRDFDASIIVDTSALVLLEQLQKTGDINWLKTKPCIVLDHHTASQPTIDFASVNYLKDAVSSGEIIYELAQGLKWPRSPQTNDFIVMSIMSDSLGLTSESTSARSIRIVAELVEQGVSIPKLENMRRATQKKSRELLKYKGQLLKRVEYSPDGRIAMITIPWEEIEKYSPEYNPPMLVMDDMRMVNNVALALAFKTYPDGRITAKLRTNYGYGMAADLANRFDGGGHPYAAGFKITDGRSLDEVKAECIRIANELLDTLKEHQDKDNETIQYAYSID